METSKFITYKYAMNEDFKREVLSWKPNFGFGSFSEVIYYRTYSRIKEDGNNETWNETVIRCIEGIMSIRKNHMIKNRLYWNDSDWDEFVRKMTTMMFNLKWSPPGRGLWACGTVIPEEFGSAALCNCGAVSTENDLVSAACWTFDMLMLGVGVGFDTKWKGKVINRDKSKTKKFVIPDSREGWVESLKKLLDFYFTEGSDDEYYYPEFDYSKIRPAGMPIKRFGGVSSGYEPLKLLHERVESYIEKYKNGKINNVRLICDIFNSIGSCVVAGNIRRSAEICLGRPDDDTFLNLKNYEVNPDRIQIGWTSNNSVVLEKKEDFEYIPEICKRIRDNGEPGFINLINIQKYGRMKDQRLMNPDKATLCNPCGEISLESYELCNLATTFISRCKDVNEWMEAVKFATFYASTVALLPTHSYKTNSVLSRNRRIGVSISGIADIVGEIPFTTLIRTLRNGYDLVKEVNAKLAQEAGVPASIKLTCIKPEGTVSLLAGVSPGIHYPLYNTYIRRVRISSNSKMFDVLKDSGIYYEPDKYSSNTMVFEFPIKQNCKRVSRDVNVWEQAKLAETLQYNWADNMVSVTIYFRKNENIADLVAQFIPLMKCMTLLPIDENKYEQAPYEEISDDEYYKRIKDMKPIDWSKLSENLIDDNESKYCTNDTCTI